MNANQPVSLDVAYQGNDVIEDQSMRRPEESFFDQYDKDRLQSHLQSLTERESNILSMRYGLNSGEPMTLEQIGNTMSLTRERIRQIEEEALKKLHSIMTQDDGVPEE
jgi:RNA polymerase primary sigma factor